MKLDKKKELAARTLKVGKDRIVFNKNRLNDIKDAITKQDIRDFKKESIIIIKEIKGRKSKEKRKTRRRAGSIKIKKVNRKREYVIITRKLRDHISMLKTRERISVEEYRQLRKEIKSRNIRSLAQMKQRVKEIKK